MYLFRFRVKRLRIEFLWCQILIQVWASSTDLGHSILWKLFIRQVVLAQNNNSHGDLRKEDSGEQYFTLTSETFDRYFK